MVSIHKKTEISILLPVYNGAKYITCAIESLQRQTETNFELLVVDDGSQDHTKKIVNNYAQKDKRIHLIPIAHGGIVKALNTGIEIAQSPLLARMDADDFCYPKRLQLQKQFLESHSQIGLVSSLVEFGGHRENNAGYALYIDWINTLIKHSDISLSRFIESPLAHPSVMFRKELITKFGKYQEGPFPEDYELWLRLLEAGVQMAKIPEVLVKWNDPPQRLSRTDNRYSTLAFYQCKSQYLANWLKQHNPYHPNIVVWGAGRVSRKRAELLTQYGIHIKSYIDVDQKKVGQIYHTRPVWLYTDISKNPNCFIVSYVANHGVRKRIMDYLRSCNRVCGIHFICAA